MARFTVTERRSAPARAVFSRLVDWDAHSAAIPLTRLTHEGAPSAGQRIVARTGGTRWGFDDPMEVRVLRPPAGDAPGDPGGLLEVRKTGPVIAGWVRCTVTATTSGSVVRWTQELTVPWLPRRLDPLVGVAGRAAYRSGLRRLLRTAPTGW
jgi:hypothetical protein